MHVQLPSIDSGELDGKVARQQRRRVFKAGIISYQNQSITVDCIVKDYNSNGAKLKFSSKAFVPDLFTLTIPVDGTKVDCEVRWRSKQELGVAFVSETEVDNRNVRKQAVDVRYVVPQKSVLRRSDFS